MASGRTAGCSESRCRWRVLLRSRAGRPAVFPALLFLAASFFPCVAAAEGISGYLDLGYNTIASESTSTSGNVSKADGSVVTQRYNLSYNRTLYPYLRLYANGLFDKADCSATINGTETELTTTTILPTVDLTLRTPIYLAGINFSRRIDTSSPAERLRRPITTISPRASWGGGPRTVTFRPSICGSHDRISTTGIGFPRTPSRTRPGSQ